VTTVRRAAAICVAVAAVVLESRAMADAPAAPPAPGPGSGPARIVLWPEGAPLAVGTGDEDRPSLELFPVVAPASPGGAPASAVIVCPGGGYERLAVEKEGIAAARWLTERGVVALVLRYRVGPRYHYPAPVLDVLRAVRLVRARAKELGVAPDRIGVWGFSAGGHLASVAATFPAYVDKAEDAVDKESARPDFAILSYPVIFMREGAATHAGSRRHLLGDHPDPALAEQLSTETRVSPRTPPTFLFHTSEDHSVPPDNSLAFYQALRRAGVPAELHVYQTGGHGVGLHPDDPILATWTERLADWLRRQGVIVGRPRT
jgi:acetyl esterase/lipase